MRGDLLPEAHALSIFRCLPNGEGRRYSSTWFPKAPWAGCARFVRQCRAVGWIDEGMGSEDCYGVLDVLAENGDIIQDFPIPSARAFQAIKKKLGIVVEELELA